MIDTNFGYIVFPDITTCQTAACYNATNSTTFVNATAAYPNTTPLNLSLGLTNGTNYTALPGYMANDTVCLNQSNPQTCAQGFVFFVSEQNCTANDTLCFPDQNWLGLSPKVPGGPKALASVLEK